MKSQTRLKGTYNPKPYRVSALRDIVVIDGKLTGSCSWAPSHELIDNRPHLVRWHTSRERLDGLSGLDSTLLIKALTQALQFSYPKAVTNRNSKQDANHYFVTAVNNYQGPDGTVAYLDAQDANTTRNLIGTRHQRVLINFDRKVIKTVATLDQTAGVLLFPGTAAQYLRTVQPRSLTALWLDYCTSFNGNAATNPSDDLDLVLDHTLVREGGILGLTVCTRTRGALSTARAQLPEHVLQRCRAVYPNAALVREYSYVPMLFLLIKL